MPFSKHPLFRYKSKDREITVGSSATRFVLAVASMLLLATGVIAIEDIAEVVLKLPAFR